MVKYKDDPLDAIFAALSDPTRRGILESLSSGCQPVTELAQSHNMSLPGFMKHLRVLESAGLIGCSKDGRVVSCKLSAAPMQNAAAWMSRYEKFWNERLDSLARYLYQQEEMTSWKTPPAANAHRSYSSEVTKPRPKKSGARGPTRKR